MFPATVQPRVTNIIYHADRPASSIRDSRYSVQYSSTSHCDLYSRYKTFDITLSQSVGTNCRFISDIPGSNTLPTDVGTCYKLTNNLYIESTLANNKLNNNLSNCNSLTFKNNVKPLATTLPFVHCFKSLFASNSTLHVNQLDHESLPSKPTKKSRTGKRSEDNTTGTKTTDNTTRVNKATFVPTKVNSANKLTHREPIDDSATASAKYNAPAPGFNRRCSSLLPKHVSFSQSMQQQQVKIYVITVSPKTWRPKVKDGFIPDPTLTDIGDNFFLVSGLWFNNPPYNPSTTTNQDKT